MAHIRAFAGIARAPFLVLPVTLVAAGAASAAYEGQFSWSRTLLAFIGLTALHIAVNVFNEWSDLKTGIDLNTVRTPFSGGSGTLPSAAISSRTAFAFGLLTAAIGLLVGIYLLLQVGWSLLPLMVIGAVFVLGYTDMLARIGVGEIAAGLGLGGLPVAGTALVQAGEIGAAALAAAIPATFMTFNLLLLNEFPDEEADREGGRRNLVILLGRASAARIYALAAIATPSSLLLSVLLGALPWISLFAIAPSILLLRPLRWALDDPAAPVPHPALAANVMWILFTNLAVAVSLAIVVIR